MEIEELEEALEEIRPDDLSDEWGFRLVVSMIGQVSEGLMRIEGIEGDITEAAGVSGHSEEEIQDIIDGAKREMIGGLMVSIVELAAEHDVSVSAAAEERLQQMQQSYQSQEAVEKWREAGLVDESGSIDTDLSAKDDKTFH